MCKVSGDPTTLSVGGRTAIHNSTARQMERLFNALLYRLQTVIRIKMETFKNKIDEWLRGIPDTPRIDDYVASVEATMSSIIE